MGNGAPMVIGLFTSTRHSTTTREWWINKFVRWCDIRYITLSISVITYQLLPSISLIIITRIRSSGHHESDLFHDFHIQQPLLIIHTIYISMSGRSWSFNLTNLCQYLCVLMVCVLWVIYELKYIYHSRVFEINSSIIYGGLLSGGFHALSGPDHLTALLPSIVGKYHIFYSFHSRIIRSNAYQIYKQHIWYIYTLMRYFLSVLFAQVSLGTCHYFWAVYGAQATVCPHPYSQAVVTS